MAIQNLGAITRHIELQDYVQDDVIACDSEAEMRYDTTQAIA